MQLIWWHSNKSTYWYLYCYFNR